MRVQPVALPASARPTAIIAAMVFKRSPLVFLSARIAPLGSLNPMGTRAGKDAEPNVTAICRDASAQVVAF